MPSSSERVLLLFVQNRAQTRYSADSKTGEFQRHDGLLLGHDGLLLGHDGLLLGHDGTGIVTLRIVMSPKRQVGIKFPSVLFASLQVFIPFKTIKILFFITEMVTCGKILLIDDRSGIVEFSDLRMFSDIGEGFFD
jgi:hypothetical protein